MSRAIVEHEEKKYMKVAASTTDTSGGYVIPNGDVVSVHEFRANGADPQAYVALIWDYQGGAEIIFASTKGDINVSFDVSSPDNHITGDGVKALKIIIINDDTEQTPIIGGAYELVKVS